ncbi:MAG: acyl-CoA dehydrogenase family protein [Verrucomicrobia bacterium]|nr:acyl-CoA dehydrogenase family protein [Verrucomicrobiota bacterium]
MKEMLEKPLAVGKGPTAALTIERTYPPVERNAETFDPKVLQSLLDGVHVEIRNSVKHLITQPEFRYSDGNDMASYRKQVLAWTKRMAETGFGRIFMPRSIGGEENLPKFIAAFETLAFHDISLVIKLGVQFGLFAGSIQRLGTEYHQQKYLPDAAAATLMGCFAMTEIGHGSNVQGLETTAVYHRQSDSFLINSPNYSSGKNYIGNAAEDGRLAVVFAQLEVEGEKHGVHAFLVPIRGENGSPLPGVTIEDNGLKMGLNGVDNGRIWFHNVKVPRVEMLNRFAEVTTEGRYRSDIQNQGARFFTMIGTLVSGRISIAATANSATKSALTIAIRYAARRRQFGSPKGSQETLLLDYPAHQRKLCPLIAKVFAFDFALKHLVDLNEMVHSGNSRSLETLAAGLKAVITWNTTQTIQTCREACGGEGYLAVNRISALKADTDIYTTFEGDNTVLMQLVAKNLLSEFQDKLKEMRPAQKARFFIGKRLAAIAKRNPGFTFKIRENHLRDTDFQVAMFRFRESAVLFSAGQEFQRLIAKCQLDQYAAFAHMQRELLDLAHAHIERMILERFARIINTVQSQPLKLVLKRVCDLFALAQIESNKGWYLEHGALTGWKSKAVTRQVDKLCSEVRQEAVHLVDSFGIPDSCLGAPIAL